jgi:hypothetical protein
VRIIAPPGVNREPERNALGRSRGGFSTKINARTNAAGLPIGMVLTANHRALILRLRNYCRPSSTAMQGSSRLTPKALVNVHIVARPRTVTAQRKRGSPAG